MRKIGVFICHCGVNIARTVDVERVAETLAGERDVAFATHYQYMCSDPGQNLIKDAIEKYSLDGVVVGCCTPTLHKSTFMNAAQSAGLNKYNVEIANIREQCSWVHKDRNEATHKAISLVKGAVAKISLSEPLYDFETDLNHNALVIGGGIAGMQAALDIADAGYKVYLVEKESSIGGRMAQLDKTFPTLDCSACILTPKTSAVAHHENIELMTYSEVESVDGYVGNFRVKVRRKATFVDWDRCNGCGECLNVCPIRTPSEFQAGIGMRTAIYRPFPQAVPNKVVIDKRPLAPCRFGCPAGVNAQGYVALASQGKFAEALALERKDNPLASICGRICSRPCESQCKRGEFDEPISIRAIKRFISDYEEEIVPPDLPEPKDKKVAIVGAGPSGLSCAYQLARRGFKTVIFDEANRAGGMLVAGIPEFRLSRKAIEKDIEFIKSWGVEFELGRRIEAPERLLAEGFDAVYIATGAHRGNRLGLPGEELDGVMYAIDFLKKINSGERVSIGNNVIVIGGGNSAIDTARAAVRLGAEKVTVVSLHQSFDDMFAYREEIDEAIEEGVEFEFLSMPVRFIGENGKLTGVEFVRVKLGEYSEKWRMREPIPIEGSQFVISADSVLPAIGQRPDLSFIPENSPIEVDHKRGRILVDETTLATSVNGVFAGGDATTGPASAVDAVAAGKKAAESIRRFLEGIDLYEGRTDNIMKVEEVQFPPPYKRQKREKEQFIAPEERIGNFEEVSKGLSEEQVIREAGRCLACGGCVECGECEKVCEPQAIVHDMIDRIVEIDVATIIVATGYDPFDPVKKPELGYEENPNVITGLQFERLVSPSGPTGGEILIDGRTPKKVVLVHCVGSRDATVGNLYCSRVCCMYLMKHAHLIKEHLPKAEITAFYMDIRAFGKGYEEFYDRVRNEGVMFRRGSVSEIYRRGDRTIVRAEDTIAGEVVEVEADLVILGTGVVPRSDVDEIARKLRLPLSQDGFLLEAHPKLRPVDTFSDGIFLAGTAQAPRDIPDTVAHAKAAASSAMGILTQDKIVVAPIVANVDAERCSGCRICEAACEYGANEFDEKAGVMTVNPILCKGCGACATVCPSSAITVNTFKPAQIFKNIDALLR
ncbi:FAD-dependent oxidoreductase [bacterium]|nr:FAD-dependent oxidoreductase [bacterium]